MRFRLGLWKSYNRDQFKLALDSGRETESPGDTKRTLPQQEFRPEGVPDATRHGRERDPADRPNRRADSLTRQNAAGTSQFGTVSPGLTPSWPLPFLSDVFMSGSAGHSSFSLCVCPSVRSAGLQAARRISPTPRRRPLFSP